MGRWGLAKDEFTDNGNWPHQIYVREARRMVGDYVMTERTCAGPSRRPDSVGMGSYNMDSHNVQRYVDRTATSGTRATSRSTPAAPTRSATGRSSRRPASARTCSCRSACASSHIAYGSIRMEPVFMVLGQSAATAASLAIGDGVAVQQVDRAKLRDRLRADGQVLELPRP